MNKICIVQCANLSDQKHIKLINGTSQINKKYANFNGYDYIFENLNKIELDDIDKKYNNFLFFSKKYEVIKKYIQKYDYIVYLDVDACFVNPQLKIEEIIKDNYDFYGYQDSLLVGSTIWPIQLGKYFEKIISQSNIDYFQNIIDLDTQFKNQLHWSFLERLATIVLNPYSINGRIFNN